MASLEAHGLQEPMNSCLSLLLVLQLIGTSQKALMLKTGFYACVQIDTTNRTFDCIRIKMLTQTTQMTMIIGGLKMKLATYGIKKIQRHVEASISLTTTTSSTYSLCWQTLEGWDLSSLIWSQESILWSFSEILRDLFCLTLSSSRIPFGQQLGTATILHVCTLNTTLAVAWELIILMQVRDTFPIQVATQALVTTTQMLHQEIMTKHHAFQENRWVVTV